MEIRHARDEEIEKVFTDESSKPVVTTGPYSADNEESVCDCVGRLVKAQEKTKDKLIIVPRVYINRPRAIGEGCVGIIHQPGPERRSDMSEGVLAIHHMHMGVLRGTGFSTAGEILYPENMNYPSDMMPYVAVGIRPVGNQFHRLVISSCNVPAGMKNPIGGDLTVMLSSAVTARLPHDLIFRDFKVQCPGNPPAHTVLRGAVNKRSQCAPNYHYEDLKLLLDLYNKQGLQNSACIMDTNYANSSKQYQERIRIVKEVLHSHHYPGDIRNLVKGLMIKSYIEPGSQKIGEHCYGKSITSLCLGRDDMERLPYKTMDNLG